jgi:uncharacterized membrane protein
MKQQAWPRLLLILATIAAGLIAGLFYAYSCSVNPGLNRLDDTMYLFSMQSINRAILNPVFFASFMGTLVLLPLAAWRLHKSNQPAAARLLWAATGLYALGVFGVTMLGNVPLNDLLDRTMLKDAGTLDLKAVREQFETRWNMFHQVRTVTSVVVLVLCVLACCRLRNREAV